MRSRFFTLFCAVFICFQCDSPEPLPDPGLPIVTTSDVILVTNITAKSGGKVTDDKGQSVTARGVVWSENPTPTLADFSTEDGAGGGIFVSQMKKLKPETTYFVRAYATNANGTGYGLALTFKTLKTSGITGYWEGTYQWECTPTKTGSVTISFDLIEVKGDVTGTVSLLGGQSENVTGFVNYYVNSPAQVWMNWPETSFFAGNGFSGTSVENSMTGTSYNGDSKTVDANGNVLGMGCSAATQPTGHITLTRVY